MITVCPRVGMAVLSSLLLAGCSVGMALSGNIQKDTSILFVGAPRAAVIDKLGQPETSAKDAEGRYMDSYVVVKGNAPSVGRALGHITLDVFTLGLWEFVGTPIEAIAGREERFRALVHYDADERVRDVRRIGVD